MGLVLRIFRKINYLYDKFIIFLEKRELGFCGKNVVVYKPCGLNKQVFLYDYVYIKGGARFIIGPGGKFVVKKNAHISDRFTVITGKHSHMLGEYSGYRIRKGIGNYESTVTVGEDAMIGANVTIMANVTIGRGAQVGACSLVTKPIPPYAIAVGVPAKVIKFIFTPEQIIEHEKVLYSEEERLKYDAIVAIQEQYLNGKK